MKIMGFALIMIGIIMIVTNGFNYKTAEKVVDLGGVKIVAEKNHPIQWSPVLGGVILIAGVGILVLGKHGK